MANFFDQFDSKEPAASRNFFDQFDPGAKPADEPGLVGGTFKAIGSGIGNVGRAARATFNAYTGDNADIEDVAAKQAKADTEKPIEIQRFMQDYAQRIAKSKGEKDEVGVLDAIGDFAAAAWNNKTGFVQSMAEQLPNAVPVLAGAWGGAKAGAMGGLAVGGPVGATVGGIGGAFAGMFLGNTMLETGFKSMQKAEGGLTDAERGEAIGEGAAKGSVIAGIDLLTLGLGGTAMKMLGATAVKAGAMAEAKVLLDAGVDVTSKAAMNAALAGNATLKESARAAGEAAAHVALTTGRKAAMAGTGMALETVGEGVGEYFGEMAATGKGDVADAVMEAAMGAGQSAIETAYNYNRGRGNHLNVGGLLTAGSSLPRQPEPAATPTAPAGLLGYQAGPPLVVFPDGSTMTRAEAEQYRLDAMVQPVTLPAGILNAPSIDEAISEAIAATEPTPTSLRPDIGALSAVPTGFGRQSELADLIAQEQPDLEQRRGALAEQQGAMRALRSESDLESADARVEGARLAETRQKRLQLLDAVYANPDERTPAMTFLARLEAEFPNSPDPTPEEKRFLAQRESAYQALKADRIAPSLPNESDFGIREAAPPTPAQPTTDRIAIAQRLLERGNRLAGDAIRNKDGRVVFKLRPGEIDRLAEAAPTAMELALRRAKARQSETTGEARGPANRQPDAEVAAAGAPAADTELPRSRPDSQAGLLGAERPDDSRPAPAQPDDGAAASVRAAGQPAVEDFLSQGQDGRWRLSRPFDGTSPDTVRNVIAELDRRNQEGSTNAAQAAQAQQNESSAPQQGAAEVADVPPSQPAPRVVSGQRRPVLDDARQAVPLGADTAPAVPGAAAGQDQEADRGAVKVGAGGTVDPQGGNYDTIKAQAYKVASGLFGKDIYSKQIQNDWQKLLDAADARDQNQLAALAEKYRTDFERDGMGAGTSGAGPSKVKQARPGAAQLARFALELRDNIKQPQNPEASRPTPVAESQARAVPDSRDAGVASGQDVAAPAPNVAAQPAPAESSGRLDETVAAAAPERAYSKGMADLAARRMTSQGLPSEAVPHPTEPGKWAVREAGKETTEESQPVVAQAAPFATFEETKAALKINGDPRAITERLQGIRAIPRKGGVNVPIKFAAQARALVPVAIEERTVDGVPQRLAKVTIETMGDGTVTLKGPGEISSHRSVDEAIAKYRQSYADSPEQASPLEAVAERVAAEAPAAHVEQGKAEPATPAVVKDSLSTGVKNSDLSLAEQRAYLLGEIDRAIAAAPDSDEHRDNVRDYLRYKNAPEPKSATERLILADNQAKAARQVGFVTFDVPGDGKFKVLNSVDRLREFRKTVETTAGFKKSRGPTLPANPGPGSTITDMLADGELLAAREMAAVKGKPFMYGVAKDSAGRQSVVLYPQAKPLQMAGREMFVGRAWNPARKEMDDQWQIVDVETGAGFSSGRTESLAIAKGEEAVAERKDAIANAIQKLREGRVARAQEDLAAEWEQWAEKAEPEMQAANEAEYNKAQAKAAAGGKAQTKPAEKAQIAPEDKPVPSIDYKGFERSPLSNGAFELIDGNMRVMVTPMSGGNLQAFFRGAKSSPYMDEQGAVDWAAQYREDGKKAVDPAKAEEPASPVIPEGYKKVTEYYRDNVLTDGYAPFAQGERVRLKSGGGNAGVVENYIGAGPVFPRAFVRFDNGNSIAVSWREVEAERKEDPAEPTPELIIPPSVLSKTKVTFDRIVNGEHVKDEVSAEEALADLDEEIAAYEKLLKCVKGAA